MKVTATALCALALVAAAAPLQAQEAGPQRAARTGVVQGPGYHTEFVRVGGQGQGLLFEPNTLNRFSVGTKNKSLKYGANGSLTIYVQNDSPGKENESNWLPAPRDEFSLYIRSYWPKAEILEGKWTPPPVKLAT